MRLEGYIKEAKKPELKEGEWAVRYAEKQKVRDLNPRTNRMKNFKRDKWFKTDVPPEDRSFKNMPRYADKKPKCRFQDWLGLSGSGSDGCQGYDGRFYGWSHRAVASFGIGDVIKPGTIGNKFQYGENVEKTYQEICDKQGYEEGDKWIDSIKFEPYTIKTEKEAKEHAIRFGRDVS